MNLAHSPPEQNILFDVNDFDETILAWISPST